MFYIIWRCKLPLNCGATCDDMRNFNTLGNHDTFCCDMQNRPEDAAECCFREKVTLQVIESVMEVGGKFENGGKDD